MLGRLKMDVEQCISAYRSLSEQAFKRQRRIPFSTTGGIKERFSSKELEAAVKRVLKEQGHDENALLKDTNNSCKVFVSQSFASYAIC
jgi:hypothetical protein